MQAELIVLRIVHVLCGMIWVGSAVFMGFFLAPALQTMGPAAGQVMGGLQKRKFMIVLPIVAVLTMLTGLRLMMIMSGNFGPGYFQSPMGKTFAGAGVIAILAFVIGIVVNRPTMVKMGTLQQSMASDPVSKDAINAEIRKLQKRMAVAGTVVTVMLVIAAAGMAIARYM
jgi:uncharacterized membrane protein